MRERPILFSGPMVRAILEGRKTQTRRIVKPQPVFWVGGSCWYPSEEDKRARHYANEEHFQKGSPTDFSPYGQPGDHLWVRETWFDTEPFRDAPLFSARASRFAFRADADSIGCHKWRPSIHMPRAASRITLEVTGIRVERLQEISGADCLAEGVGAPVGTPLAYGSVTAAWNMREYARLWEQINGPGSWGKNPWVWVIEFWRITS